MATRQRKQNKPLFEDLVTLPWYLNAGIAAVVYFPIKYLPMFVQPQSPTASAAVAVASDLAVFVALIPFAAAIISGVRSITAGDNSSIDTITEPSREIDGTIRDDVEQIRQGETDVAELSDEACDVSKAIKLHKPESINMDLLAKIEWKRFENLCKAYLEVKGKRAETTKTGPDGGVDIRLFKGESEEPMALVKCKAWNTFQIGEKQVRELYEAMVAEGAPAGICMTAGSYTREAKDFAKGKNLILVSGSTLVKSILGLPNETQRRLLGIATEGDYTTPTCPGCGTKMVLKHFTEGGDTEGFAWGCIGEPRCGMTFEYKPEMA